MDKSSLLFSGDEMNWLGFREITYESILPACLVAPLKPSFDLNDGQCFLVSSYFWKFNRFLLNRTGRMTETHYCKINIALKFNPTTSWQIQLKQDKSYLDTSSLDMSSRGQSFLDCY